MNDATMVQVLIWIVVGEAIVLLALAWFLRRTARHGATVLTDLRHEFESDFLFLKTRMDAQPAAKSPCRFNAPGFKDFDLQIRHQLTRIEHKIDQGEINYGQSDKTN